MNKISVIIPVYNAEKYLKKCIDSVLQQTYTNIELILVDDGSTDASLEICNSYKKKNDNIVVIHQENRGQTAAIKTGLYYAAGEYIGFMDSDDFVEPMMYEDLLNLLLSTDADFVHSEFFSTTKVNYDIKVIDVSQTRVAFINQFVLGLGTSITASRCTNLYKNSLIKTTFCKIPDEQRWCEDWLSLLLCSLKANKVAFTSSQYYHFVFREKSFSHSANINYLKDTVSLYNLASSFLKVAGLYEKTQICLKQFYLDTFRNCWNKFFNQVGLPHIQKYSFKNLDLENKRIIIYGAGVVGKEFYSMAVKNETTDIVAWVDKKYSQINLPYYQVKSPDLIKYLDYDLILIAVLSEEIAQSIKMELISLYGCKDETMVWVEPHDVIFDMIAEPAKQVLEDNDIV